MRNFGGSRRLAEVLMLACVAGAIAAAPASASHNQEAMFQEGIKIQLDPDHVLSQLRLLGVDRVRLFIHWKDIAPQPNSHNRPGFHAVSPAAYPASNWAIWDRILKTAKKDGIAIDLDLGGGAPLWATGPGAPTNKGYPNWEPSASEFGAFVHAIATRYSGNYDPNTHRLSPGDRNDLPAVQFWSVWNEPDYGPSLAPQGLPGNLTVEHSPMMYRGLLDAAWTSLQQTGHGRDTILFGEVAPRGYPNPEQPTWTWGVFSGMKPLVWLRALYCVDSQYRPLQGTAAALRGCPTTSGGSRAFRAAHPALFKATGFADHPYSRWYQPNTEAHNDPDYAVLADMHAVERALDRVNQAYGSSTRFPIWNTEYGYITSPPKHSPQYTPNGAIYAVSQSTAANYLNWAEYISWKDPRLMSTMQFLLADPEVANKSNDWGGFASGLMTFGGAYKPTYAAYRLPLYLPAAAAHRGQRLEVWGCVRPADLASLDTAGSPQAVQIQFKRSSGGPWTAVKTMPLTDPHGYFDTRVAFPSSGTVRLSWTYPTDDPLLVPGRTTYSRQVQVTVR